MHRFSKFMSKYIKDKYKIMKMSKKKKKEHEGKKFAIVNLMVKCFGFVPNKNTHISQHTNTKNKHPLQKHKHETYSKQKTIKAIN